MKTKTFVPFVLFAIISIACVTDQLTSNKVNSKSEFQKNWKTSELTSTFYSNQATLSHYEIDAEKLREISSITSVSKFRFMLGLNWNQQLQIEVVGVDQKGVVLGSFYSIINTNNNIKSNLDQLQYSNYTYNTNSTLSLTDKHLLPYKNAYTYINNWEKALQEHRIEALITYNNERIRYFSMPKEVVQKMVASQKVTSIALFLGLNNKNKLTTVFIQKNSTGYLLLNNSYNKSTTDPSNTEGNIYDFTSPCPDICSDDD